MKQGGPIQRKTELRRGAPMRRTGLRPATPSDRPAPARKPRKDTGATPAVRLAVLERDEYMCVRCAISVIGIAWSIQHKYRRGMGGTRNPLINTLPWLCLLCGTGTTGCHGEVENHDDPADGIKGYRLKTGQDATVTPMYLVRATGARWVLPTSDGTYTDTTPPEEYAA